jgi:hypothetical protein
VAGVIACATFPLLTLLMFGRVQAVVYEAASREVPGE